MVLVKKGFQPTPRTDTHVVVTLGTNFLVPFQFSAINNCITTVTFRP
jgi:hypothetical protein